MAGLATALQMFQTATASSTNTTFGRSFGAAYQNYDFPTDNHGRRVLPTLATLEGTSDPGGKLAVAGQLADVIEIQVNAATRTGLANRVADMTARSKEVMNAVKAVVDDLKTKDGSVQAGDSDPALEPYQKELAHVLGTLRSNLAKLSDLLSKAKKDVAAETDAEIRKLDTRGQVLASLAGLNWEPLPDSGVAGDKASSQQTDPTKLLDIFV